MSTSKRDEMRARLAGRHLAGLDAPDAVAPEAQAVPRGGDRLSPMAQVAKDLRESVEEINEQLRAQIEQMRLAGAIELIPADRIVRTKWCNRHPAAFTDSKFRDLCDDIKLTGGNEQPICVRPMAGADGMYEIVYGHRRHAACTSAGKPVRCIVKPMSDRELVAMMRWENADREDLSKFEEGISYYRQLADGLYATQNELAEALGLSKGYVSSLLAFAELPDVVISALGDPRQLSVKQGAALRTVLGRDSDGLTKRAEALSRSVDSMPFASRVRELLGEKATALIEFKDKAGRAIVRATKSNRGYQLDVQRELTRAQLKEVVDLIEALSGKGKGG